MEPRIAMTALADLLGALAHPDRLCLLLELAGDVEHDVAHLSQATGLSQPRTSQHLALLRGHHLVASQREGRRMLYRLTDPQLLAWLAQGARFLVDDAARQADLARGLGELVQRLQPE